jgi:hypothetical protein
MKNLLTILAIVLSMNNAFSCSCPGLTTIDSTVYNKYSSILIGKILSVDLDTSNSIKLIGVLVKKNFHGTNTKGDTLYIATPLTIGACGLTPKIGESWLLFAVIQGNRLYTNRCSRSGNMDLASYQSFDRKKEQLKKDLEFL